MSDSILPSTKPNSTRIAPSFDVQAPIPVKIEAADPVLVKEVEKFLATLAANPAQKLVRDAASASPETGSKINQASAPKEAVLPAGHDRPTPDVSSATQAVPVESSPKLDQVPAGPEQPLTTRPDRKVSDTLDATPISGVENDPKIGRAAASAELPLGTERQAPEASSPKPNAPAASASKVDQRPGGDEPPPHPGPDNVKAVGPERAAVEAPASPAPARQRRKPKAAPTAGSAERPADARPDTVKAPAEAQASTVKVPSQPEIKPEATVTATSQEKVHAMPSPGSGRPEPDPASASTPAPAAHNNAPQIMMAAASKGARATAEVMPGMGAAVSSDPTTSPQALAGGKVSSALGSIMSSMRQPSLSAAPWKAVVPPIGARIAHHEQRVADGKTTKLVSQAEKSGVALEASLDRFMSGPARGVMTSLKTAAASDPGGMPAVIAGMKPGGAYAAERVAFDTAMKNPAVGADYTAVAESAQRHAKDRYAVENNLHQRGLDPAVLGDRFTKKDAELGEKAASIPGREAGKNAMEEMAQKLAELLRKAMEKVGQAFGRTAGADVQATATARPSPSPSPAP